MTKSTGGFGWCLVLILLPWASLAAARAVAQQHSMPREDVVDAPAVGDGLCVSNVFQSNMVIQRDRPIDLWGWADPGEAIAVSFGEESRTTVAADDRTWQVTLPAEPASSVPRSMLIRGEPRQGQARTLTLENILVGDVWILGGQSNMEFEITKVDDGPLEVASANFPEIRLLTLPQGEGFESTRGFQRLHEWSDWSNRHFRKGDWEVCTPQSVQEFSAIGYIFGRRLQMATRIPIGLIDASIGGTTVETWTPVEVLEKIEGAETKAKLQEWREKIANYDAQADLRQRIENFQSNLRKLATEDPAAAAQQTPPADLRPGPAADRNRPGYCYASVIRSLEGLSIKGAVFHQGFNNCFEGSAGAEMYRQVFGEMLRAWRAAFRDPNMPFCIISLCTAGEPQTDENFVGAMYDAGVLIREAQYQTFLDFRRAGDKHVGYVSSYDLRKSWYHPQIKIPAGERAATWALVTQYQLLGGRDADQYWVPPVITKVERVEGTLRLTFDAEIKTRDDSLGKLVGFAIAGDDRRFYPAEVRWYSGGAVDNRGKPIFQRDTLVLGSPFVSAPTHFRHAWARNPMSNLVNGRGVPLATERSDDWILEETPVKPEIPPNLSPEAARNFAANQIRRSLEMADNERRIRQAEANLSPK